MSKNMIFVIVAIVLVIGIIVVAVILKPNKNDTMLNALGTSYLDNEAAFQDATVSSGFDILGGLFNKKK